jgi:DNA-binding PadR family transcriptional regulator
MLPLNYAILKLFMDVDQADASSVMTNLAGEYGSFRQFTKKAIIEALMTAEANGLLVETDCDLDENQQLRIYYRTSDAGRVMIERYIGG